MPVEAKQGGNNPMEQFVLLAKGAKGMAAAELVKQALDAPGLYVFSELLDIPNIKELETGEFKGYWDLINIFAYGTFKEYVNHKVLMGLPELNQSQVKKLKYLTIVTLSESEKCIPYKTLLEELSIEDIRELEDLIIEAIYAEIIEGKLDQSRGLLEVDNSIGRDIRTTEIPTIVDTLESWCDACENVLGTLQTQMDRANVERSNKIQRKDQLEIEIDKLKKTLKAHPLDSDEIVIDSREAMGIEKTPKKGGKKTGLRGSTKPFK